MRTLRKFAKCGFFAVFAAVLSFVSCTDDSSYNGDIIVPEEVNLTELEQYSYAVPIEIKSNTEWEIDFDFEDNDYPICYAFPKSGKGNATVKLCVLDNWTDVRRKGTMYITFPNEPSKNKEIALGQKCNLDPKPASGVIDIEDGNIIYGVGYGYNYLGHYADIKSVSRNPIIKIEEFKDNVGTGGAEVEIRYKTFTGNSAEELSNKLSATANFGGNYLGFKGEVGATFNTEHFSKTSNEYAITYVEKTTRTVYLYGLDLNDIIGNAMTDAAYDAINGRPVLTKRGLKSTKYPSTPEGMKQLITDYGTHLLTKAILGGRAKYSMTVDVSQVEGSYDLNAFAKCSYSNAFVNTSAGVKDSLKASFKNNSAACQIALDVKGGSLETIDSLTTGKNLTSAATAWLGSLNDIKNSVLIGLDPANGMIPLYDLVDLDLEGGKERYEYIKNYILGLDGMSGLENATASSLGVPMTYQNGVTAIVELPTFNSSTNFRPLQTLVKDVYSTGQRCARVCEEYIPVINANERVKVVYPIISSQVKYNMGMFVGDATHRPAKVCWEGNSLSVTECSDLPIGEMKKFYVRGSSVSGKCYGDSAKTTNEDVYLSGTSSTVTSADKWYFQAYTVNARYPLVKIFGNVWARTDYQGLASSTGYVYKCGTGFTEDSPWVANKNLASDPSNNNYKIYYGQVIAGDKEFAPGGWRLASSDDYKTINETLIKNGISSTGIAFFENNILGFAAFPDGLVDADYAKFTATVKDVHDAAYYWTSDKKVAKLTMTGGFNIIEPLFWDAKEGKIYHGFYQMRMVAK